MKRKSITVSAPATVANVACGFDALGFAVNAPSDVVSIKLTQNPGIIIHPIRGLFGNSLSRMPEKNTASIPVQAFLQHLNYDGGVEIILEKNLPLGSGMGSSASSAAAAVFAINELFDRPFTVEQLVPFAMEAERVACGTAHADNVAPALLGGFVLIRSYEPLDIVRIPTPENLYCTIIHPQIELRTEDSRKILRKEITLKSAVTQWSNVAGLIAGLATNNTALISRSLQDVIIEPLRGALIPGFEEVKLAALKCGVLGCSISGSGPSVFALSENINVATKAAAEMQTAFQHIELKSEAYVSKINMTGAKIIKN